LAGKTCGSAGRQILCPLVWRSFLSRLVRAEPQVPSLPQVFPANKPLRSTRIAGATCGYCTMLSSRLLCEVFGLHTSTSYQHVLRSKLLNASCLRSEVNSARQSEDCWKLLCHYRPPETRTTSRPGLWCSGAHFIVGPGRLAGASGCFSYEVAIL